jgi:hypothetical protein
MLISERHIN